MDLRSALYAKLVRLSFGFFDRHQTGQLMSRATVDLQSVRFFLGYGLIFFFQHVFTVLGVGVLVFVISWKLALIALAVAPVMVAIAYRYSNVSLSMLIFPLRMLGMWIGEGQRATASGERIFQVIDEPEQIQDAPGARPLPDGPGIVRFEHVTFGYDPARPVLEDVDLELEPGRRVALIGP